MRKVEFVEYSSDDGWTAWERFYKACEIASNSEYETPDYIPGKGYKDVLGGWHKTKKERDDYDSIGY